MCGFSIRGLKSFKRKVRSPTNHISRNVWLLDNWKSFKKNIQSSAKYISRRKEKCVASLKGEVKRNVQSPTNYISRRKRNMWLLYKGKSFKRKVQSPIRNISRRIETSKLGLVANLTAINRQDHQSFSLPKSSKSQGGHLNPVWRCINNYCSSQLNDEICIKCIVSILLDSAGD